MSKELRVKLETIITEHLWICSAVYENGSRDLSNKKPIMVFFTKPRYHKTSDIEIVNMCYQSRLIDLCASQNTKNLDEKDFFKTTVFAVKENANLGQLAAMCNLREGGREKATFMWMKDLLEIGQSLDGCLCVGKVPHYKQRVVLPPSKLYDEGEKVPALEDGEFVLIELIESLDEMQTSWRVRELTTGKEDIISFKDSRNKTKGDVIISKVKIFDDKLSFVKPFKATNNVCENNGKVVTVKKMSYNFAPGDGNYRFIVTSSGLYSGIRVAVDLRGKDFPQGEFEAKVVAIRGQWICVRPC